VDESCLQDCIIHVCQDILCICPLASKGCVLWSPGLAIWPSTSSSGLLACSLVPWTCPLDCWRRPPISWHILWTAGDVLQSPGTSSGLLETFSNLLARPLDSSRRPPISWHVLWTPVDVLQSPGTSSGLQQRSGAKLLGLQRSVLCNPLPILCPSWDMIIHIYICGCVLMIYM